MRKNLAIALGGFGGSNNHGAGFLQALKDFEIQPDLITATSGQIIVLFEYLENHDLHHLFKQKSHPLLTVKSAIMSDGFVNQNFIDLIFKSVSLHQNSLLDLFSPCKQYIPTFNKAILDRVVNTLQSSSIGVMYNSYNVACGTGTTYANAAAKKLTGNDYNDITPESIMSALWLTQYGMEDSPNGLIDGAYHRSIILNDLIGFKNIIVVKPIPTKWNQDLPSNNFDVEDWKIKMLFANSYKAELSNINIMNQMIGKYNIDSNVSKIIEFEINEVPHIKDFIREKQSVFDSSYTNACELLKNFDID